MQVKPQGPGGSIPPLSAVDESHPRGWRPRSAGSLHQFGQAESASDAKEVALERERSLTVRRLPSKQHQVGSTPIARSMSRSIQLMASSCKLG